MSGAVGQTDTDGQRLRAPRIIRRRSEQGGTLIGMFIGLILGLALAAGIAYYLSKGGALSPAPAGAAKDSAKAMAKSEGPGERKFDFYNILPGNGDAKVKAPDTRPLDRADKAKSGAAGGETGKAEPGKEAARADATKGEVAKADATKPDATKAEAPRTDVARVDPAKGDAARTEPAKGRERIFLQAGAFASEAEAEKQKASLALAGWEAAVQAATLPDKTTWYRVRVGPFDSTDEMNRQRSEMQKRGIQVTVIRNP